MGFEKALGTVKVIKDQIQYRSQSLLNLTRGYFRNNREKVQMNHLLLTIIHEKFVSLNVYSV